MPYVDTALRGKIGQDPSHLLPILITCEGQCKAIMKALKRSKIRVTGTDSLVLGIIGAEIRLDQLGILKSIKGISAIEYDQEAEILN